MEKYLKEHGSKVEFFVEEILNCWSILFWVGIKQESFDDCSLSNRSTTEENKPNIQWYFSHFGSFDWIGSNSSIIVKTITLLLWVVPVLFVRCIWWLKRRLWWWNGMWWWGDEWWKDRFEIQNEIWRLGTDCGKILVFLSRNFWLLVLSFFFFLIKWLIPKCFRKLCPLKLILLIRLKEKKGKGVVDGKKE